MMQNSQWFKRGWTLQELLAPRVLCFFARDWTMIGFKVIGSERQGPDGHSDDYPDDEIQWDLTRLISKITDIPQEYLTGKRMIAQACVAQRMYWAAHRTTTRAEDRAYSLMGLFDINMPILYGEGLEKAFMRLQQEIIARSPDQSILAWYRTDSSSHRLLADSPSCFENSRAVAQMSRSHVTRDGSTHWSAFWSSNLGLEITLPFFSTKRRGQLQCGDSAKAALYCSVLEPGDTPQRICLNLIFLKNDINGHPIFMCHRTREWNFSTGVGRPVTMFLGSNDYILALSEQRVINQPDVIPVLGSLERFMSILAEEIGLDCEDLVDDLPVEDLGLDSLLVLQLGARIRDELQLDVATHLLLESRTVAELKQIIAGCESTSVSPADDGGLG